MKRKFNYIVLVLVFSLFFVDAEAQCAMCRAVLENGANKSVAEGINNGIVYLMAFPYLLVGGIGYYIYRTYRTK